MGDLQGKQRINVVRIKSVLQRIDMISSYAEEKE